VRLKKELTTNPELRQLLLAQYVPLELKVGSRDHQRWSQFYKPGKGIPMIHIVSSRGEMVYGKAGAPTGEGLKRLLVEGIEKTGGFKQVGRVAAKPATGDKPGAAKPAAGGDKEQPGGFSFVPDEKAADGGAAAKKPADKKPTVRPVVPRATPKQLADSYLRRARRYEKSNPTRAYHYAGKAIEALPDSEQAREAKALRQRIVERAGSG